MALTVDEIAEILNTMRVENEHNVENFEKVLTGINNKIELMADDSEATDLIKLYLSELKKIVEDKHNSANDRFKTLENSINNILSSQEQTAKTSELRDLFHVLGASFDSFSGEFANQTNTLQAVDEKLEQIEESVFNKGELASLLNGFASDLSEMNSGIDKSFRNIETSLENAIFEIGRLNVSEQVSALDNRISSLSEDVNAIPSKISFSELEQKVEYFQNIINSIREAVADVPALSAEALSDRFFELENSFKNIVTEQNFSDFKENLADFVRQISDNAVSISADINANRQKIENIFASINTLDYKNDFNAVSEKITALEEAVNGISQSSAYEIQNLGRTLSSVVTDSDFAGFKADLAGFVQKIIDNSTALNAELSRSAERIENILSTVNSLDYTDDFETVSKEISELKSALNDNLSVSESINSALGDAKNEITKKLDGFETSLSTIVTDSDFAGFKADLADFVQKIIDNSSALNSELSYSTERIENILTTIRSLDFRDDFAGIESRINDLKETFDAGAKINYTNLSEQIAYIKEGLESGFENIDTARNTVYSDLKSQLTDILNNLDAIVKSNPQKSIDELSSLVLNLSETASVLRSGISSDIQGDYGDLKSSIGSVITNLQIVKEDIIAKNTDFYNSSSENSLLLETKLEQQLKALDELKNKIDDAEKFDPEKIVASIQDVYTDLSGIIADLKEDSGTNYEAIKSYIEELSSTVNSIREEFLNLNGQNSNLLGVKIDSVASDIYEFREEFKQSVSSDVGNFSAISGNISELSEKLDGLKGSLAENSDQNFQSVKLLLDEMSAKLSSDIEQQKDLFSRSGEENTEKQLEAVRNIASDIKNIQVLISENKELFNSTVEENIKNIREYIGELSNSIYESGLESENKFNTKLEALDVLNHGFENLASSVEAGIKDVLSAVNQLDASAQNSLIQTEINAVKSLCESLLTSLNDTHRRSDELSQIISSLMEIVLKKDDINEISFKMDEYTDIMNSLREFTEASFANASSDINGLFEKVEASFANIFSKEDFSEFKRELSEFLQTITDNSNILNADSSFNREKIQEISDKIAELEIPDYSYDLTQITSKIDDLSDLFANSSASNFEGISQKLDDIKLSMEEAKKDDSIIAKLGEFSELIDSLKNIISVSADANSSVIEEQISRLSDGLANVVTEEDFTNFRIDFGDFIQKILDNADVLHLNSESNKEQINKIAQRLEELNYTQNFENLDGRLNEIRTSFENNSKMNYENITNDIQNLKELLNETLANSNNAGKENFDRLNFSLTELSDNIQVLLDMSSHKPAEILDKISEQIQNSADEISENVNNGIKLNIEDVKASISGVINEITSVKDDFTCKNDSLTFSVTSGFDSVKLSLENILTAFNSLNDDFKAGADENIQAVSSNIDELTGKVDELKDEIHKFTSDYSDRVYTVVNEISDKLEGMSAGFSDDINVSINELKNYLSEYFDNSRSVYDANFQQLKDMGEIHSNELNSISGNITDFRGHVDEIVLSLKDYITELNAASKSSKSLSDSKFSEKLVSLESVLVNNADAYEEKFELLQGKLAEFAQTVESVNSDTENKIVSSIEEIKSIKEELASVTGFLNSAKLAADEQTAQIMSMLDTSLENVTVSVNEISSNAVRNINSSINENILSVEDKLTVLLNTVENLKDTKLADLADNLGEKFSELKQELGLINTDIADAFQTKSEDILRAFEPVKTAIEDFSGYDFEKLLNDVKSMLETSFMNFSVDVNGELSANSEAVLRLEQAYKETFNKISVIEECVSEDIQNSIELLNVTIETNTRNLKCGFEEKLDEYINDLKSHLDLVMNDTKTLDSIENLKDEISVKLDTVLSEQNSFAEQANVISAGITTLGDDIKNYVQSACENTIDKYSPIQNKQAIEALNQKVDTLVDSSDKEEILNSLYEIEQKAEKIGGDLSETVKTIMSKMEVIEKDNSLILAFHELASKLESFTDDNTLNTALKTLSEKIDIIASDQSMEELRDELDAVNSKIDVLASDTSIDELQEKFDELSQTEDKVSEMLSALHEKVDAIAMDGGDFDIEEEIDDIKSLIFEQRKFFEASSDEKSAAIDKYLRDVLMKLDNVDLEKNSEDIKESIMNALVSLFDQISFVEESEDIKDFVEEKTDEINQNLIEVQNQLRQIASSNDDFDYSYTLQDVESDIAKLRMAINNMPGSNFESLSDDIKKIVNSVEGLESSLTQEQTADLKSDIEKLNEDILSISSRTNKLLLTSDESYKALNDGLNNFSSLVYKLEDRINYLDNTETSERLERKIDSIHSMASASANADKVFHQVLMYLGEWIDSTTENIASITDKTSEISKIKESLQELKDAVPEKTSIIDEIQNKFEEQELRIDRLEMKLEKILSTLEQKDDMMLNRKVDKIEKLISRLGTNIEKLTSYVDEE